MAIPEFGTASLLEILWTVFGLIGLSQYAYGWWDVEQDRRAIRGARSADVLRELVDSDLEYAILGFVIMALFTLAGALALLAPTPVAVSELNAINRIVTPLAFFLAEVLFIFKKYRNIQRRRRQRRLVALRNVQRTNAKPPL